MEQEIGSETLQITQKKMLLTWNAMVEITNSTGDCRIATLLSLLTVCFSFHEIDTL